MITHIIAIAFAITAALGDKSVLTTPPAPAQPIAQPAAPAERLPLPQRQFQQLAVALQLKHALAGLTLDGIKSTEKDRYSELVVFCHNAYGRSMEDIERKRVDENQNHELRVDTAEFFDDQVLKSATEADEKKWEAVRLLCEQRASVLINLRKSCQVAVFWIVDGWVVGFHTRAYDCTFFYTGPEPKPEPPRPPTPQPCPPGYGPYRPYWMH